MSSAIDLETRRCNGPRGLVTRREVLRLGALGLSLPGSLALRASALGAAALGASARASGAIAGKAPRGFGRAESCIVLFAWGGMSHIDTWDLKPDAGSNIRSAFQPIPTRTPGYQICEHLPRLAQQTHRMAIVLGDGEAYDIDIHEPGYLADDARRAVGAARRAGVLSLCLMPGVGVPEAAHVFGPGATSLLRDMSSLPLAMARLLSHGMRS